MDKMNIFAAVFKYQCYETPEHHCHHFAEHPVLRRPAVVLLTERVPPPVFRQHSQGASLRSAAAGHVVLQLFHLLSEAVSESHFSILVHCCRSLFGDRLH